MIVGSFRPAHGTDATEVWSCLLLDRGGEVTTLQQFLPADSVRITVEGKNVSAQPKLGTPARFRWEHQCVPPHTPPACICRTTNTCALLINCRVKSEQLIYSVCFGRCI